MKRPNKFKKLASKLKKLASIFRDITTILKFGKGFIQTIKIIRQSTPWFMLMVFEITKTLIDSF